MINLLTGKQETRTNRTSLLNHAITPSQSKPHERRTMHMTHSTGRLFFARVVSRKKDANRDWEVETRERVRCPESSKVARKNHPC